MKKSLFLTLLVVALSMAYDLLYKPHQTLLTALEGSDVSCAALVAVKGEVRLAEGWGYANQKNQIKNTPNTQFLIASITKVFTATAILKLMEDGKICVTEPVITYLPPDDIVWAGQVPAWATQVTIHDLLTHSSGLENYIELPGFASFYKAPHSTEELIQFFAHTTLKFKPGTRFEYSGTGYNVLGAIIERVSEMSFADYLHTVFFKPLKMSSTFAGTGFLSQIEQNLPSLALGYTLDFDGILTPSGEVNMSTAFAEASIISTAFDLYTWSRALFDKKIISEQSLNKMVTPYLETDEKDVWMGYGIFIDKAHHLYCHSGRINGYESLWIYEPAQDITVIVLSNEMRGKAYRLAYNLLQAASQK